MPCRSPKGHSLFQNSTTTARMAPSWMTTRNMDMNSSLALNLTTCSTKIMWPGGGDGQPLGNALHDTHQDRLDDLEKRNKSLLQHPLGA